MINQEDGIFARLFRGVEPAIDRPAELLDAGGQAISRGKAELPRPAHKTWTYFPDDDPEISDKVLTRADSLVLTPDVRVSVVRPRWCRTCAGLLPHIHLEELDS